MGKRKERPTITLADPTRERLAKGDAAEPDIGTGDGRITLVSPLERYWRREIISGKQYAAGLEYRSTVYLCGFGGLTSSGDLAKVQGSGINWDLLPRGEAQVAARQIYALAVREMGQIYAPVVDGVILYERSLEDLGRAAGYASAWGVSVAKKYLLEGLDRLANVLKA